LVDRSVNAIAVFDAEHDVSHPVEYLFHQV
jgi:hypothetical protein